MNECIPNHYGNYRPYANMAAAIKLAQIEFHHPFCVCLAYGSETCGCVTVCVWPTALKPVAVLLILTHALLVMRLIWLMKFNLC